MLYAVLLGLAVLAAAEIFVIITVAHLIGGLLTAALLIASTIGGLWIARRERQRAWIALREALSSGEVPDRELADAAVILVSGVLIAIPGFITDVAGLFAVIPFTRPAVRRLVTRWLSRRAALGGLQMTQPWPRRSGGDSAAPPGGGGKVVQGEVVEEHTSEPGRQDGRADNTTDTPAQRRDGDTDRRP